MSIDIIKTLHRYEVSLLEALDGKSDLEAIAKTSGLKVIEAKRACQWLENKNLINTQSNVQKQVLLGKNGESYKKDGLPETRFLQNLTHNYQTIPQINKKANLSEEEIKITIGTLKKKSAIDITKEEGKLKIKITSQGKKIEEKGTEEQIFLKQSFPIDESSIKDKETYKLLLKRKDILVVGEIKSQTIEITPKGRKVKDKIKDFDFSKLTDKLTPEMLKTGKWKNKEFRHFDVLAPVPKITGGRKHPLSAIIDMVRDIFVEMGFEEMKGPLIETSFWCLDSMWIPQDHPARDVQDTFYLPYKGKLPQKSVLEKVKKVHEDGGDTGSKGYGYKWNPEMAKQLLMRTHTTATTYRYFHEKNIKERDNAKYFYIGRVFRNEAIDATHLPEFHQVEGFVMQEGLTLKHLMGFIKTFYAKLGLHDIKFKVTYNPYTETSLEAMYFDKKTNSWIELINSGIFRPESLAPYGINKPIIAWGLGLERLAMILYEKNNIKEILGASCDIDWLKTYKIKMRDY